MRFALSFAQTALLLEVAHFIDFEHSTAFRARLKHLQRLGFPTGINTGKGKAAQYGWREIILIAVALELIELGLTPERAISICSDNEHAIIRAFCQSIVPDSFFPDRKFLVIHIGTLDHLRSGDIASSTAINILPAKEVRKLFGNNSMFSRIAIVNLYAIASQIGVGPSLVDINFSEQEILDSIVDWAVSYNDQHPET